MCVAPISKAGAGGQHGLVVMNEFRPWRCILLLVGQCHLVTVFNLEEFGCSFVIKEKLSPARL